MAFRLKRNKPRESDLREGSWGLDKDPDTLTRIPLDTPHSSHGLDIQMEVST